jgi:hypothetical protein
VHARHPGWAQRAARRGQRSYTAEQVIVSAHAYGSAKLLHRMQHKGRLTGLSSELGKRARTNSEQLLYVTRTNGEWKRDPDKIRITPGSVTITSGVWPDPVTSIEPTYWGLGSNVLNGDLHDPYCQLDLRPESACGGPGVGEVAQRVHRRLRPAVALLLTIGNKRWRRRD